jgi:transcriptional regulator with XRE-family HTH domain
MSKLSELAKQHREMLHETQEQFARRFGFESATAVSLWEAGKRRVPPQVIESALDYIPRFTICEYCSGRGMLEIKL